jgi:hypothetical protein
MSEGLELLEPRAVDVIGCELEREVREDADPRDSEPEAQALASHAGYCLAW